MKKIYFLIIILTCTVRGYGQTWKWVFSNYVSGSGDAVAFDKSGNLFLSGANPCFIEKFNPSGDSLWFKYTGFGVGTHNMALSSDTSIFMVGNGYVGASSFVVKCDKEANIVWSYWNNGGGQYAKNRAHSIAVDSQGNSFASGVYEDSAKFGNCSFSNPNVGTFVVKLLPEGNCLWSMDIPNGGNYFSNLTIDKNDDLIISTPDSIIKVSNNQIEWVVPIKELKEIWHPNVGEVKTDSDNNIYFIVGGDSIQIGQSIYTNSPYYGLLVKLTPLGDIVWVKEISGSGEFIFIGKAIYLTSFYDTRIQKISLNGDSLWCRSLTSDNWIYFHIYNLTGSDDGLIAITGMLDGVLVDGNDTILKANGMSPFVAVLDDKDTTVNINEKSKSERGFTLSPNPSSGLFTINSPEHGVRNCEIKVCNIFGEIIYHSKLLAPNSQLDLSREPKGIYFVQINSEKENISRKIIIE